MNNKRQFLEERWAGLGGSDMAVLAGVSPHRTLYDLYREKTEGIETQQAEKPHLRRGRDLEGLVIEATRLFFKCDERTRGGTVSAETFVVDEKETYLRGHIDAFLTKTYEVNGERHEERILCEAKTVLKGTRAISGEQVPLDWQCQIQHYMAITGTSKAYLGVLVGSEDYFESLCALAKHLSLDDIFSKGLIVPKSLIYLEIAANPSLQAWLRAKAKYFWRAHILARVPPPAATYEDIQHMFPQSRQDLILDTSTCEDGSKIEQVIDEMQELTRQKECLEKSIEEKKMFVTQRMGEASSLQDRQGQTRIHWKSHERSTWNVKKLEEDHPPLAAQYKTLMQVRPFKLLKSTGAGS